MAVDATNDMFILAVFLAAGAYGIMISVFGLDY